MSGATGTVRASRSEAEAAGKTMELSPVAERMWPTEPLWLSGLSIKHIIIKDKTKGGANRY